MSTFEVKVPNIGDFHGIPVIEILVKAGDLVRTGDALLTLESEKSTMDVPSPADGRVLELRVKVGDKVNEGTVVLLLEPAAASKQVQPVPQAVSTPVAQVPSVPSAPPRATEQGSKPLASPLIRKLARELGVDLTRVTSSGPRGRLLRQDILSHVKGAMSTVGTDKPGTTLDLPAWPVVDFAKFGPVERLALTRIQRLSGPALARNWVRIPHVTQFDEADITDLECFRVDVNREAGSTGLKLSLLPLVMKACVAALKKFPTVNSSLDGGELVLKRYCHIGFAADTPQGLVVPVVRDVDRKGVREIGRELGELASKAREGKLGLGDSVGGSFSISSLGGIGGTAFTPIINAPEVAILGLSRSAQKPVWQGDCFVPRLMLPLSFSYDHRVIDGALAARFTTYLAQVLGDLRRVLL